MATFISGFSGGSKGVLPSFANQVRRSHELGNIRNIVRSAWLDNLAKWTLDHLLASRQFHGARTIARQAFVQPLISPDLDARGGESAHEDQA